MNFFETAKLGADVGNSKDEPELEEGEISAELTGEDEGGEGEDSASGVVGAAFGGALDGEGEGEALDRALDWEGACDLAGDDAWDFSVVEASKSEAISTKTTLLNRPIGEREREREANEEARDGFIERRCWVL